MPYLSGDDFDDWAAYYELDPWGQTRDDMRHEAWLERLMVRLLGTKAGDANVTLAYPYFPPVSDPAEQLAAMKATEERLVWDGTRHVWKK